MTAEEAARWIANEIIGELKGRRGLRHEWEAIDDECKEEIAVEWAKIARLAILTRERAARVEALSLAGTIAALALPEAQCHSRCYVLGATLCYRCQCVEAIHRALAARAEEEDRG